MKGNNDMNRNLDGVYFRIKRDNKWENICFSDMSTEERLEVLKNKDNEFLKRLCLIMAEALRQLGDELDITRE